MCMPFLLYRLFVPLQKSTELRAHKLYLVNRNDVARNETYICCTVESADSAWEIFEGTTYQREVCGSTRPGFIVTHFAYIVAYNN